MARKCSGIGQNQSMEGVRLDTEMTFAILGPLEIRHRGKTVEITGQRLRTLFGLLLLDAGRVVPVDRLIDGVWEDCPPNAVGNALQALISRLRAVLADQRGLVEAGAAGYRMAVDPDRVDAHRFALLAAEGRTALTAGAPGDAATALHAALALWRGPPWPGWRTSTPSPLRSPGWTRSGWPPSRTGSRPTCCSGGRPRWRRSCPR